MITFINMVFGVCFMNALECQILKNNPKLDAAYVSQVSKHVSRVSNKYGFPSNVYAAILAQESAYKLDAINCHDKGCDRGISQIYDKTAEAYGFDKKKLMEDLSYSIESGAIVLAWFYDRYGDEEPLAWWSRYNCGTRKSIKRDTCQTYARLVKRWM